MAVRTSLPRSLSIFGQFLVAVIGLAIVTAAAYAAFVWYPTEFVELVGVVLVAVLAVVGFRVGGSIGASIFPDYNVAKVTVEGPITRDGATGVPTTPGHATADELVEQIELADDDPAATGLMLELNTPGGEIVPSDDIRDAAERFDGPTIAYTTDMCASGGYWIASGCDELWARDASIVGSIGVRGSRLNLTDLIDRIGMSHERFVAGEYKDAGSPFRDIDADDREYLQGLIDRAYEFFLDRVADGSDLDPEFVRETEARVYLGEDAHEIGLVDDIGDHLAVEDRMATLLDTDEVTVKAFEPERPITLRLRSGVERAAFALGAGIASRFGDDEPPVTART